MEDNTSIQAKEERYTSIKEELQQLYCGKAKEYSQNRLYPPPGMWYSEQLAPLMLKCIGEIKQQEETILQLEAQVAQCAVVLPMHQPLTGFGPQPPRNDKRDAILMDIASANGEQRIQEDLLTAYQAIKPVSPAYMEKLKALFAEKKALALELFEARGVLVPEW